MFTRILLIILISVCIPLSVYADEGTTGVPDRVTELEALVVVLQGQVASLFEQLDIHDGLLADVSRFTDDFGYDTLQFSGMNVQIINGEGLTHNINGEGNLIIGYNESREARWPSEEDCPDGAVCDRRDGSHMLVIGKYNNYTSYGGMVV